MAGKMKALETLSIGDGEDVGGHVFDGQCAGTECAAADTAVVRRRQRVAIAQRSDLRPPALANHADALHEDHGWAAAFANIPKHCAAGFECLHVSSMVKR